MLDAAQRRRDRPRRMIPRDPAFDSTRAFFREGYRFVGNRCRKAGSDAFRTRIMLRRVVCMMGENAARRFYDGRSFTRVGAMPQTTLRLLQDKGSVQLLDGAAHAHRKQLFIAIGNDAGAEAMADAFQQEWLAAVPRWREVGTIFFHDAMIDVLTGAACRWVGLAPDTRERSWLADGLARMIDRTGSLGPGTWAALLRRRGIERWARHQIRHARESGTDGSPLGVLAQFHDANGELLSVEAAAVELLNLIRPIVAVARFLTFGALALHEWRDAAEWVAEDQESRAAAFAEEVRRYYPFFPVIGGRVRAAFSWQEHCFVVGDWVLLGLHATNHDARIWDAPDTFRPERFIGRRESGFDLVPQGAGDHRTDHRCSGETITRRLIVAALGLLRSGLDYDVQSRTSPFRSTAFRRCRGIGCA